MIYVSFLRSWIDYISLGHFDALFVFLFPLPGNKCFRFLIAPRCCSKRNIPVSIIQTVLENTLYMETKWDHRRTSVIERNFYIQVRTHKHSISLPAPSTKFRDRSHIPRFSGSLQDRYSPFRVLQPHTHPQYPPFESPPLAALAACRHG